ncbi:MAG: hypothetical protein ACRYF0_09465 [Janthinobacterium lividum]
MEMLLKCSGMLLSLIGACAGIYNLATTHSRARQRDHENRQAVQLEATTALAIRTEQRVTGLDARLGSFEQRIERRMDQVGTDISQVKDLFTNYLLTKH